MRSSGSLASSVSASYHAAAAAAAVVSNTSSYSSVAASDGENPWAAAAGLPFLPTVAARLQSGLLANGGAELPHTPVPPEEAFAANPAAAQRQAAPAELSEQFQQQLDDGLLQGQKPSAGDGEPSSGQPGVAPPPEPASPQEPSSLPVPAENPACPSSGGVEPVAPGAAPAAATASRRTSSRSFRQHRAMRALRAQSGGSSGSGGASSGGLNSRSSSRPMSRSTSRAASLREPLPAAAGVAQSAASAQRLAARSIEQSLDPLLRARVEELAEQAVAARLRRRLSSGDTLSPVLTDDEILAADVAGIFRGGGNGGSGLESQRCAS